MSVAMYFIRLSSFLIYLGHAKGAVKPVKQKLRKGIMVFLNVKMQGRKLLCSYFYSNDKI